MRGYRGKQPYKWLKILFALILVGVIGFLSLFGTMMYGDRDEIKGDPQLMIVLGARVMPDGQPSIILQDRLNTAYDYWVNHPDMTVIVAGGQGSDEPTTEAFAMSNYLVNKGIPEEQILQEDKSHNTNQNLRFSVEIMEEAGYDITEDVMIVTSGLHLSRARMLWGRITGETDHLSTLAAPMSHDASRRKMYIREPLALVKSFLIDR